MIPFRKSDKRVTNEEMSLIYEKIKTPLKYGAVIKFENELVDCPSVFKKDGVYYMYFISISKNCDSSGYETHLAKSQNLKDWEYVDCIFKRNDFDAWDSKQCSGYVAFKDINFDGTNELHKVNGNYYVSYMGTNKDGYEPDPLMMGMAKTDDPINAKKFKKLAQPILTPDDSDSREHERKTLYKSFMFEDLLGVTGFKYVNVYNAKDFEDKERIFLAVSNDGENWERYGDKPIVDMCAIDPTARIAGDPQIVLIDDIYVMFFFYFNGKTAYNTFACSRDLVNWNIWNGKPLVEPEFEWENKYAHKTWFLRENNVNYHFYCAVNDKRERFIALATSE